MTWARGPVFIPARPLGTTLNNQPAPAAAGCFRALLIVSMPSQTVWDPEGKPWASSQDVVQGPLHNSEGTHAHLCGLSSTWERWALRTCAEARSRGSEKRHLFDSNT